MADRDASRDPGSFRDPSNAVFHLDDRVLRGLDAQAHADWKAVAGTDFFRQAIARGQVVGTTEVDAALPGDWDGVLEHDRIPFRSYPYEWSFSMLQDAAITHLELLAGAVEAGLTMADGTAYNVQWQGASPVFIDVLSFRPSTGEPWAGYRQFCQTMLFPLLVQAHRGFPARLLLRSHLEGIEPGHARRLLGPLGWTGKGVVRHVHLHALADARMGGSGSSALSKDLAEAGFGEKVAASLAAKLLELVRGLSWKPPKSGWTDYADACSLTPADRDTKARFVRAALGDRHHRMVWDLGCNDGTYSRIAAERADTVVAVDADEEVVDRLYRARRAAGDRKILPLVLDLLDPSPGLGWRNRERAAFWDRGRPDVVLALALVHHLTLAGNVPLADVVDWLASFGGEVVLEVPHRDDPMVQRLLSGKPSGTHDDYSLERFEALVAKRFAVQDRVALPSGTRTILHLRTR
jgi:SAM-dependent methyltransferase